jgi:hypothetical protein
MKVLVCGGRDYSCEQEVEDQLFKLSPQLVITGGAHGADALAARWAERNGIALMVFRANWNIFGKAAGPIRNGWMLIYGIPDLVVAFPGGVGTADMVNQARKAGIEIKEIKE